MVKRFIIQIILLTFFFVIAGIIICWFKPEWFTPALIYGLIFIVLLSTIIYYWLYQASQKNAKRFDVIFRLSLFVKMFGAVAFIVPLVMIYKEYVIIVVPAYLVFYISYSFLITKSTIKLVRKQHVDH
jgi:hypothetical protein